MITRNTSADLSSWVAIARATRIASARETGFGAVVAVVSRNGTEGNVEIAVDAIKARRNRTISCRDGRVASRHRVRLPGMRNCHIILRACTTLLHADASTPACADIVNAGLAARL